MDSDFSNEWPEDVSEEVDEVVTRGTIILDMHDDAVKNTTPWWRKIDLSKLDMGSTKCCILGQLFGDYSNGNNLLYDEFPDDYSGTFDHGFSTPVETKRPDGIDVWKLLAEKWRLTILERRLADGA